MKNLNALFYSLTRGQVIEFLIDSLGYSYYELEDKSDDEIMDMVPKLEYLNCYNFCKYGMKASGKFES